MESSEELSVDEELGVSGGLSVCSDEVAVAVGVEDCVLWVGSWLGAIDSLLVLPISSLFALLADLFD